MVVKEQAKKIDIVFEDNYENIRESLKGLDEILKINFLDNNIYYQLAMDNLKAVHDNVLDLLKHTYSPREVRIKLREIEYEELEASSNFLK
jgi:hypothetical protein